MEPTTKPAWQSKTMLLNGVAGLILFVTLFYPPAQVVTDFIAKYPGEVGLVWTVVGMALRWVTKDKVVLTN